MKLEVKKNKETKLFDLVDASTGVPVMHASKGNRIDGGGHVDQASAERQKGYLQKFFDKKDKEIMG